MRKQKKQKNIFFKIKRKKVLAALSIHFPEFNERNEVAVLF